MRTSGEVESVPTLLRVALHQSEDCVASCSCSSITAAVGSISSDRDGGQDGEIAFTLIQSAAAVAEGDLYCPLLATKCSVKSVPQSVNHRQDINYLSFLYIYIYIEKRQQNC